MLSYIICISCEINYYFYIFRYDVNQYYKYKNYIEFFFRKVQKYIITLHKSKKLNTVQSTNKKVSREILHVTLKFLHKTFLLTKKSVNH